MSYRLMHRRYHTLLRTNFVPITSNFKNLVAIVKLALGDVFTVRGSLSTTHSLLQQPRGSQMYT